MTPAGRWISFKVLPPARGRKTATWLVVAHDGLPLGAVKWFGRWRCFSFFPRPSTVFEADCLRDIASFCSTMTSEYRDRRRVLS